MGRFQYHGRGGNPKKELRGSILKRKKWENDSKERGWDKEGVGRITLRKKKIKIHPHTCIGKREIGMVSQRKERTVHTPNLKSS